VVDQLVESPEGRDREDLIMQFAAIWGTVRPIIITMKDITGPKIDAIIDEVVKIGDLLAKI
jgi:hypothetical protein